MKDITINRASLAHYRLADRYLKTLAMPAGALGDIHETLCRLAGVYQENPLKAKKKVLVLSAADHGICAQGVSPYPQITNTIVKTALHGGVAINAFCRMAGCDLKLVDAGLLNKVEDDSIKVVSSLNGTQDFSKGLAVTVTDCQQQIQAGIDYAFEMSSTYEVLGLGEMGIGNTTSAAAITAAICQLPAYKVTGKGSGIDSEKLIHKADVIQSALDLHQPNSQDGVDVLSKVGGLEIAFMTGLILGWSSQKKAIILDGFITGAAALAAFRINEGVKDYLFAGHESAEPGHKHALQLLGLKPIKTLLMRLGEGTGATLAMQTIDTGIDCMSSMMTLSKALSLKVNRKSLR
ncbi:MAG: nicotinate-nucleotide--dimethylbenzimidazole phosphoribosyltransferase [Lentisphaeraceae bacterium]|nr:nicotinate-nucleotide--dimethylbenzimidazole phosphoribosyltransferase [Lentisphaeraceae bacterium]